ncbi:MAG: M36 family metallopeptidase [Flavobacteriales bacterium]|nr:M36 family metallopeptidase [Flavobacteriales bacterium]MCC6938811.1 M36 family metallopeptidase [Flavobacteriales bacterium]
MASNDPVKGLKAKIHRSERYGTVQRIYTIKDEFKGKDPKALATAFLKLHALDLGLDPGLRGLRFEMVRKSIMGMHVMFQQFADGKPVSGAWVRVDVSPDGELLGVQNGAMPVERLMGLRAVKPKEITGAKAKAIARKAVSAGRIVVEECERVVWPVKGKPHEAWKLVLRTANPTGLWRMYIDATNGTILGKRNTMKRAWAQVFDPTPVAALDNTRLDPDKEVPPGAYRRVELQGLDGSGYLDGEHVSTKPTKERVRRTDGEFIFSRTRKAFREVMAYHHIDAAARHLIELGFEGLFKKPMKVKVHGYRADNSEYDPGRRMIIFGTGGVDDAEDAEVILHEYGHAIQDAQVRWFGESDECGAMGEGFGDFFAASFFHDRKPARMRPTVFNWNAISYSKKNPPHERRLDLKLNFKRDWADEVHDDGQIWSACLWELRALLGQRRAERIVIGSHHLCMRDSTFADGAHAVLTANERLYGNRNRKAIRAVFERRGILDPV